MELTEGTIGALLLAAILVAVVAIVLAMVAVNGQRRVREAYRTFSQGSRDDVLTLLQRHVDEVGHLRGEVARLEDGGRQLRELIRSGLSRVATVRYDAFEDMGGRLSFSTALLDEHGDGVVVTSISGRTDTRTYAKPLTGGHSHHNLSEEESEAINRAVARAGRTGGGPTHADSKRTARPRARRPATSR